MRLWSGSPIRFPREGGGALHGDDGEASVWFDFAARGAACAHFLRFGVAKLAKSNTVPSSRHRVQTFSVPQLGGCSCVASTSTVAVIAAMVTAPPTPAQNHQRVATLLVSR
jgi:hypothetical protein